MLKHLHEPANPEINIRRVSLWLKVLGEPNRLLIFTLLMEGDLCNCELGDRLEMAPNLVSHHLGVLRQAGLVKVQRDANDARWVYYSVNSAALEELNAALGSLFDPKRLQLSQLRGKPPLKCQTKPKEQVMQ